MAKTHASNIKRWEELTASLAANADELPHLEVQRTNLGKVLQEALEILNQQALYRANKQQSSKRLQTLMTEGERLTRVLELSLAQHYGPTNEKLVEYGMLPFRGRKRKASNTKPAPQSAEATPSSGDSSSGDPSDPAE